MPSEAQRAGHARAVNGRAVKAKKERAKTVPVPLDDLVRVLRLAELAGDGGIDPRTPEDEASMALVRHRAMIYTHVYR